MQEVAQLSQFDEELYKVSSLVDRLSIVRLSGDKHRLQHSFLPWVSALVCQYSQGSKLIFLKGFVFCLSCGTLDFMKARQVPTTEL